MDGETAIDATTFQVSAGNDGSSFSSDYMDGERAGGWTLSGGPSIAVPNDFISNGQPDILYRHPENGNIGVWYMNGTTEESRQYIGNHGTAWDVNGVGDFNGDGQNDLLYGHSGGNIGVWYLQSVNEIAWQRVGNHGPNWKAKGVGDFNNDGSVDVVYQNTNGTVGIWYMKGTTEDTWHAIGNHGAWEVR